MKILVTGSSGFIGSRFIEMYKDVHEIVGYERDIVTGLDWYITHNEIDAVIHLAGVAGIPPDRQNAVEHYNVNFMATVKLLELCAKAGIKKFVFISSSSVYGNANRPTDETACSSSPLCHYAASKKAGELACHTYCHMYGMEIACLRLFTVYGPGQRTQMAIPLFTRLIDEGKELSIYYAETPSAYTGKRDYVYVNDVVDSIEASIRINKGINIYNIGSGQSYDNYDIARMIGEAMGKEFKYEYFKLPIGYAEGTLADISKAKAMLGYSPKVDIKEGIKRFVEWYKGEQQCHIKD